ncbi:P97 family adhesin [Mesomycoplasma ovipneumoniae]|uniref:P97 family adhesin n=1 Tax=Mesomycoplasma ovipneumoniae TaxID=29562 RepID=UPI0039F4E9BF
MSKPKQKSLFNVLRKNILSKTGIAVSLFGIGVFTATAVLTTRISYLGNPRENVQNFAKKINLVSFKLGDLSANDDYYSIKNIIFDENGNKQKDLDLSRLVDVFQKTNDLNQKIDLTDEVDIHKPHLKFVDITANDDSRSFEIKYQVKQKLPDQSFVQSDIYSQEISFLQKSQFLRSNFSSKLQKIIKLFQTKFSSLKDKNSTKEFSADSGNTQATLNDNIFLRRAEDISSFLNVARTSKELENKISKLLPQIKHILFDLYNSEENLIPDSNSKIFNFSFEKNQLTNEYAFVDGRGFLNLFLKAEFSLEAQKLLDFPEVKSWIEPVRIVDNEGNSLFTTSKSLIESIELSNTESKKLVNISVLDFLNLLQTKFTLSNFDIKNKKINKEIVQIINQVLEKPLNIGLKNSSNKLPNQGVNLVFDPFNVEISKNDSKFDLKLPYRIQISEKFYGKESSEIVEEKLGVLNLENFSIIDENIDQKIDDGRYFLFLNQNFDLKMLKKDDTAKDKKELSEVKKTEENEGSDAKQVAVQEGTSTESQPTTTDQTTTATNTTTDATSESDTTAQTESTSEAEGNTQTKKQPKYKYFLLDSNNPYSKKEIDQLIQDNDFEKLSRHLQSISGYNYNYSNHESLIKAWTGTLIFPFDYANSFKSDNSLHAQKTGTISLDSTQFLQNPNETGAFYSFLAKQNPRLVVQAFVDFLKISGLIFNFVDLDRDYKFDWNKIFESARQVKLNSSNFKKFSFNNQYSNLENSGFVSTLFLPKDVKTKISTLKNDEKILESLTSLNLFAQKSDQIAKFEKIDENIANFETLADVISAFYFKAGLLNNYQNWSEIALLDSEIVFEPNDEILLSDLEEIKKQNSSGQSEDISKKYKAINYYYKLGIRDEFGTISDPLFESPKTTLILKTIDEKTAKINEVTKKLDQIIDAIPVSYQTIHLSAEDFEKLTSGSTATTGGSGASVAVQASSVSSLSSQILESKSLAKPFNDAEQPQVEQPTQQAQETQQTEQTEEVQQDQQAQETEEAKGEQKTEEVQPSESENETQTPAETQQEQDELTQKLPKFGAEISQILNKSFTSLFTSTEKDSPKLKINIEIKDDILKDPNKKLITIQVGIPESYLEKLTAEEKTDQEAKKDDETSSDQTETEQEQSDTGTASDQGQTDQQQQNNGGTSDQGQTDQQTDSGSSEPATVETKQVLTSETPPAPASTTPSPAPASPAPVAEPATSPTPTPTVPAPAETPAPGETTEQKQEKYRYSKKFNITVIKQVSTSPAPSDSTPSTTEQS